MLRSGTAVSTTYPKEGLSKWRTKFILGGILRLPIV